MNQFNDVVKKSATTTAWSFLPEEEVIDSPQNLDKDATVSSDPDVNGKICSVCGYQGKWISEMIRHKRVHTNERPFHCKYCQRSSKWKADLIRHLAKVHKIRVRTRYNRRSAEEKNSSKTKKAKLTSFIPKLPVLNGPDGEKEEIEKDYNSNSHGLLQSSDSPETVRLSIEFGDTMNSLKSSFVSMLPNMSKHSGDRPKLKPRNSSLSPGLAAVQKYAIVGRNVNGDKWLKCKLCPYLTKFVQAFRVHTQKHENKKPFQCSACGYRSNWSSDVHKHIRFKKLSHSTARVVKLAGDWEAVKCEQVELTADPSKEMAPPNVVVLKNGLQQWKRPVKDSENVEMLNSIPSSSSGSGAEDTYELSAGGSSTVNEDELPVSPVVIEEEYAVALDLKDVADVMSDFSAIINAAEMELNGCRATEIHDFTAYELPRLCDANGQFLVKMKQNMSPLHIPAKQHSRVPLIKKQLAKDSKEIQKVSWIFLPSYG
ncbi:zf-H2C2 2 domain containing protein [Trichuris trichiura]|uniref:Zf-H2C2 2 domain containing protein n=1 Tax=Trichuris trichiura TaxID=36087 RepID=A0A077Z830_TRITR|nr:zf-H2C2 2 domain containing protein [Trichuris trichiura]